MFRFGTARLPSLPLTPFLRLAAWLTRPLLCTTIAAMPHAEVPRRVKSYSSATGYTYQYVFHEIRKGRRGLAAGNEYVYLISADRKTMFPLVIFIGREAVRGWAHRTGRDLTGTEEYAAAKMRLFQALDEVENLAEARPDIQVDEAELVELLALLDL
jgi:hypothetical protein